MVTIQTSTAKLLQTLKYVKGAIPNKRTVALNTICDVTIIDGKVIFAVPGAIFSINCFTEGTCKAAVTFIHLFLVVKDLKSKKVEFIITECDFKINNISISTKTTFFKDDKILKTIQLPINYNDLDLLNLEKIGYTTEELEFNNLLTSVDRARRNILLKSFPKNISTQIEAVRYCIENMDIKMIDAFLDNKKTYQDLPKEEFIKKLAVRFIEFKIAGDSQLISYVGKCTGCQEGKIGYAFVGNKTGKYFNLLFISTDGVINDLFECGSFKPKNIALDNNKSINL
jgi:hypothetical protein